MRGLFFPIDRVVRRRKPPRFRARFWQRIAARIVARVLLRNSETEIQFTVADPNGFGRSTTRVSTVVLAAYVLEQVAEYKVTPEKLRERHEWNEA